MPRHCLLSIFSSVCQLLYTKEWGKKRINEADYHFWHLHLKCVCKQTREKKTFPIFHGKRLKETLKKKRETEIKALVFKTTHTGSWINATKSFQAHVVVISIGFSNGALWHRTTTTFNLWNTVWSFVLLILRLIHVIISIAGHIVLENFNKKKK